MDGLIVALISGAFVAGIIAHIINMRIRRKLRVGRVTEFEITTQNLIESTVHRTLADRALIIKLHNGGKIFAGVQKYITVLQEYNSENLRSVRDDFQNYKVDAAYMQMINTVISEGLFIQEVNKLPEGFLKRRYEYEGIKSTVIYYIAPNRPRPIFWEFFYYKIIFRLRRFARIFNTGKRYFKNKE
jgi:hypothetical protein